jgi:hypothetical protein
MPMERDMETDPGGVMERQLVEKYLSTRGHTLRSVRDLPEAVRRPLLAAAARYAARQMTEGETGSPAGCPRINGGIVKTHARPVE